MLNIYELSEKLGISKEFVEPYGNYIGKIDLKALDVKRKKGKLILVTGMTPTKHGEGKTTTVIGLSQALAQRGKKVCISIREPSMGPCFGVKGGATGGGFSKVEPSDRINLLFTGDFPSVTAAHNLLSAMIHNHIFHGNKLGIDPDQILFPMTMDMNERSLRNIIINDGGKEEGPLIREHFVITPASEVMSILGLSTSYEDLVIRLSKITVAKTFDEKYVYASDLEAQGAMAAILVDALKPNLAQTTEGVPAFVHTGPFGNISHGTSSILSFRMGLAYADYLVTEGGFGSDLGFEKYMNIISKNFGVEVSAVVIVATIRAIKSFDRTGKGDMGEGIGNLLHHIRIVKSFGFEPVVSLNRFEDDSQEDVQNLISTLRENGFNIAESEVFSKGGPGGLELADLVLEHLDNNHGARSYTYDLEDSIKEKIEKIGKSIYEVDKVIFSNTAINHMREIEKLPNSGLPICISKSQYSFHGNKPNSSDNNLKITDVKVNSGSGLIIAYSGDIMTMPGLPEIPAACNINIDKFGVISNLV